MEENPSPAAVAPPRGIYPARVDEKGRLKLPSAFQQYLVSLNEPRVFITSFDGRIARIYPDSVWKRNEQFFDEFTEDPQLAEDLAFVANDWGADSELDSQGRVLVPSELRRTLNIEGQPVWLDCYKGRINVFGKEVYEERKRRALQNLPDKLQTLERKGLR